MAKTTTKCEFPKCRNVGRKDWELVNEAGELICQTEIFMYICKKHLIQVISDAAEQANARADERTRGSVSGDQVTTETEASAHSLEGRD